MHGGAKGSGAPKGNQNALQHGTYTEAALRQRTEMRLLIQESEELIQSLKEPNDGGLAQLPQPRVQPGQTELSEPSRTDRQCGHDKE